MNPRKRNIEGKMILMKNVRMALSGRFERERKKNRRVCSLRSTSQNLTKEMIKPNNTNHDKILEKIKNYNHFHPPPYLTFPLPPSIFV